MSDEKINSVKTSDYGITPYLSYCNTNETSFSLLKSIGTGTNLLKSKT